MTAVALDRRFEIARVIDRTIEIVRAHWKLFGGLGLVLAGVPQLLIIPVSRASGGGVEFLLDLVGLVLSCLLAAALTQGALAALRGDAPDGREMLAAGAQLLWPAVAVTVLAGVGVGVGLILLIVPGVLLALAWAVVLPVLVAERLPIMEVFGRSAELTRRHRGALFGLLLAYVVAVVLIYLLAETPAVLLAHSAGGQAIAAILDALIDTAATVVGATGVAAIYQELVSIRQAPAAAPSAAEAG